MGNLQGLAGRARARRARDEGKGSGARVAMTSNRNRNADRSLIQQQYYKYLKFIHLEHETKIRFITEIVDDLEADPPREAIVYTPRDVKDKGEHRGASMFESRADVQLLLPGYFASRD